MTVRSLGVLLLRLWGLWWVVGGCARLLNLAVIPFVPAEMAQPGMQRVFLLSTGLGAATSLLFGTALLVGAERIMHVIGYGSDEELHVRGDVDTTRNLQSVAFGALGVYLAILALSEIARLVYTIARLPKWDQARELGSVVAQNQEALAGAAAQLIFAVALLVNRNALASLWARVHPMRAEGES